MPLPTPHAQRQLKHRRTIEVQVFARPDGLWEVDATVCDVKTRDTGSPALRRPAGQPIHDLLLRLVVDAAFNIVEAGSDSRSVPYPGHCGEHGDAYARLAGLNLMQGFRRGVKERLGGDKGCTHLTELTQLLPTAVVQGFVGEVLDVSGRADNAEQPFQIDRCHALRADGAVVQLYYPRWYRQPGANFIADNPVSVVPKAPADPADSATPA